MTVIIKLICLKNMDVLGLSIMSLYGSMGQMPTRAVLLSKDNSLGGVSSFTIPTGGSLLVILSGWLHGNAGDSIVQPSMYTISDAKGIIGATFRRVSNGTTECDTYEVATVSGVTVTANSIAGVNFWINMLVI